MYWIQSWNHGRFIKIMKESLLLDIWDWLGGIMVSTLVTHGWEVWDWDLTSSLYVVFLWKKPLSHYSLKKPLSTQDLWIGAGKLLWMPGEMLEGKVAMDKHPIKGEGGGGRGRVAIILVASCWGNQDKLWLGEPLSWPVQSLL